MVYDISRIGTKNSPFVVYVPRPEMMFKIMRACINVSDPGELWINAKSRVNPKSKIYDGEKGEENEI